MSTSIEKPKQTRKIPAWFIYGTIGIFLALLGMTLAIIMKQKNWNILTLHTLAQKNHPFIRLDVQTSRFIIKSSIPILERNAGEEDPFTLIHFNWSEFYWRMAANIKNTSPQEILAAQFPLLAFMKPRTLPLKLPAKMIQPEITQTPELSPSQPVKPTAPEVFIYHTHTSESYIPISGKDHQTNQIGDIVKVGEHLQQVLEQKFGMGCLHSKEIHDYYPFRDSYKRSQQTVIKYLNDYPTLKAVLDIHRDATPGFESTCTLKGEKTATLRIVVGSDKMGLSHPHWRKNLEFATKLNENMNLYYPGLSNGILVSEARYNQHLNDHALIMEFGDYQNSTLEELLRAAEKFAEILIITLNQDQEKNAEI